MVKGLSSQKYNGSRGKADLLKRITEKLLKVQPDEVDSELVWASYGLSQLTCGKHVVPNPKATNCKENPYCLGRLGLEKFEKLIKKSEDLRNEKMNESVRRDGSKQPCGLVNWANFCYVNSFLQIWFNDPVFRQIIFDWRPSEEYVIPAPPAMDVQQVMTALQHLFFTLETTPYEDANGEQFCKALRLNQEQQDAQEFTVMFFDSIDRNLMKHPNGKEMRERIADRFNGTQTSTLRCKCGHHSDNTTKFSALNLSIDGHTTLSAAIHGYFADERLSDFACSGCGKRGGVVRETSINHMPPVLLLSLNRYVYDSATGRRKKLKTPLQYPRQLDVGFLPHEEEMEESRYDLSAVMVHEGDNADCGHYWDIIQHPYTGVWFKYNDKLVRETKAPGVETEKGEATMSKAAIDLKFCYGLVYRRRETARKQRLPPEEISGRWSKEEEHRFYRMTDTETEASEVTLEEVTQRFEVVGEHLSNLEVKPERASQKRARDLAFLPTQLLAAILSTEYERAVKLKEELELIADNLDTTQEESSAASGTEMSPTKRKNRVRRRVKSMYDRRLEQVEIASSLKPVSIALCPHDRIHFESVISGEMKAVNRTGAERLMKEYGLSVMVEEEEGEGRRRVDRLRTGLEVCTECVQDYARDVHFKSRLDEDSALATRILREDRTRCSIKAFLKKAPPPDSLYVAKNALASFKRDVQREKERRMALRNSCRAKWTMGPAAAAAGAGGGGERKRRRRGEEGETVREAEGEEEPVSKCGRASSEDLHTNGLSKEEEKEEGVEGAVKEMIRDLVEAVASPSMDAFEREGDAANAASAAEENLATDAAQNDATAAAAAASAAKAEEEEEIVLLPVESEETGETVEEGERRKRLMKEERGNGEGRKRVKSETRDRSATDENDDSSSNDDDARSRQPIVFNDLLRCDHGGINVSEFRHMVSAAEWRQLTDGYFENAFEVPTSSSVCEECKCLETCAAESTQASSAIFKRLNEAVGDILKRAEKRSGTFAVTSGADMTRGVCSRFVENAKKFLNTRNKTGRCSLPPLCQDCVMCDHGKPRYEMEPLDEDKLFIVPLTAEEWSRLHAAWTEAAVATAAAAAAATGSEEKEEQEEYADAEIVLCPMSGSIVDLCGACNGELRGEIEERRYCFEKANIYVKMQIDESGASSSSKCEERESSKEGSEERKEEGVLTINTAPPMNGSGARTSGRTRRGQSKGLIKVRLSSYSTVKELKIALLQHCNHSPIDQLLYACAGGPKLVDEMTLSDARILPENYDTPIILIVQSVSGDSMMCSPTSEKTRAVERGFYDTALAH